MITRTWLHYEDNRWDVVPCLSCGKVILRSTAPTARPVKMHRQCIKAIRDRQQRLLVEGVPLEVVAKIMPVHPPKSAGAPPRFLKRNFSWMIRHYIGFETITAIAQSGSPAFDVGNVSRSVQKVVSLLPGPDRADARLQQVLHLLPPEVWAPATEPPERL